MITVAEVFMRRYVKIVHTYQPGQTIEEGQGPFVHWWNNFKVTQRLSKDQTRVIREIVYHPIISLKDQAKRVEKENQKISRDQKRIIRQIRLSKRIDLGITSSELEGILEQTKREASALPILTA